MDSLSDIGTHLGPEGRPSRFPGPPSSTAMMTKKAEPASAKQRQGDTGTSAPSSTPPPNRHSRAHAAAAAAEALTLTPHSRSKPAAGSAGGTRHPPSAASATPPSVNVVVGLSMQRRWSAFGALQRLELSTRWCVLQQELETLSLQVRGGRGSH